MKSSQSHSYPKIKPLIHLFSTISTYHNYYTFPNATPQITNNPHSFFSLSVKHFIKHLPFNMTRILRTLQSINTAAAVSPPDSAPSMESDFVVILAALLCALISVVGLTAIARCAWLRRGPNSGTGNSPSPAVANRGLKKKVLNSLPKFTYLDESACKWVASSECAICLSEFAAGDEIRLLPQCGHGFHVVCIDTWLGSHSSCPSCRAPFAVARCQKCGLYQPTAVGATAGAAAGETESKSVVGDNVQVAIDSNCNGNGVDRHSHTVYNGFLP